LQTFCSKKGHTAEECWSCQKNGAKKKNETKGNAKAANKRGFTSNVIMMTEEAFKNAIMQLPVWQRQEKWKQLKTDQSGSKKTDIADKHRLLRRLVR